MCVRVCVYALPRTWMNGKNVCLCVKPVFEFSIRFQYWIWTYSTHHRSRSMLPFNTYHTLDNENSRAAHIAYPYTRWTVSFVPNLRPSIHHTNRRTHAAWTENETKWNEKKFVIISHRIRIFITSDSDKRVSRRGNTPKITQKNWNEKKSCMYLLQYIVVHCAPSYRHTHTHADRARDAREYTGHAQIQAQSDGKNSIF